MNVQLIMNEHIYIIIKLHSAFLNVQILILIIVFFKKEFEKLDLILIQNYTEIYIIILHLDDKLNYTEFFVISYHLLNKAFLHLE